MFVLRNNGHKSRFYFSHKDIKKSYDAVFILSYFKIIPESFLKKHKYCLVVHESSLPKGRGWSPLFLQVLEGKNKIPVVLFEASKKVDSGAIYLKDNIIFKGSELREEIREKRAFKTTELCLRFIRSYKRLKLEKQSGPASFYQRRTCKDSKLDINRSLKEQFNLLRIVNNRDFPAFFNYKGNKYSLMIYRGGVK